VVLVYPHLLLIPRGGYYGVMKYLGFILTIGFVGIFLFGTCSIHTQADMNAQGHDMSPSNCIGAAAQGVDCPKQADPIEFATFHIDAFKGFSTAIPGENVMAGLLLAFASLVLMGLAFFFPGRFDPPQLAFYRYSFRDTPFSSREREYLRWLALHENSPAIL